MKQFDAIKGLLNDSATYYLISVDMNSNYSYVNKRYANIFNPIHGNIVGTHYSTTIHIDDQQTCQIVSQMAFTYPDESFPATIRKHDGKGGYFITRWDYKAMFDENGAPAGMFCIGHDITELMKVTGQLDQVKDEHSHTVRRHVANLIGLGRVINETTEANEIQDIAKMIVESATDLDDVIKTLYK
jgi:PAS domain S-box-containing protein